MASISLAANITGGITTAPPATIIIKAVDYQKAVVMKEVWRDVINYSGLYQVSNTGNVRSIDRCVKHSRNGHINIKGQLIKQRINNRGYYSLSLCKDGKYKHCVVHKLVAESFIKNNSNKPFINHKDGNKLNNLFSNLEWCTCSENNQHAYDVKLKIGAGFGKLGKDNPSSKPVLQIDKITGKIIREFDSLHDVQRELGYKVTNLSAACRGIVKTSNGFMWNFK